MKNLKLKPAELSPEYRKEWNVHETDILQLYDGDEKISENLYRIGGLGTQLKDQYFCLLKLVEGYYSDSITKDPKQKKHLATCHVALNLDGEEVFQTNSFQYLYLLGGVLCSTEIAGSKILVNLLTSEIIIKEYSSTFSSDEYLFVENRFDKDKTKRGVFQISKADGSVKIYPITK